MQRLVKLLLNALYGIQFRKASNGFYKRKSRHWMETEHDDIVLEYLKLQNWNYFVKWKKMMDWMVIVI